MCSIENCDLENFENSDKCILHCEKDDWKDETCKWNETYEVHFGLLSKIILKSILF